MWRLRNAPPHRKPFHSMILHEILPTPTGFYQLTTNQFDNRVASPVGVGPTNAAGVFGAIDYASFSLSASTTDLLIPPPTQPNFIYAGPLGEITGGEHRTYISSDLTTCDTKFLAAVNTKGRKRFYYDLFETLHPGSCLEESMLTSKRRYNFCPPTARSSTSTSSHYPMPAPSRAASPRPAARYSWRHCAPHSLAAKLTSPTSSSTRC